MRNKKFLNAKKNKKDEFYTRYEEVEKELQHYYHLMTDKVIYCPADNETSAFVKYLKENKDLIGYKELIYTSNDFRENTHLIKLADIVITNPPFSLFREFVDLLMEHDKKFLIIGINAAVLYNNIFPLFVEDKLRYGYSKNKTMDFVIPDYYDKWDRMENGNKIGKVPGVSWFTNLQVDFNKEINPTKEFDKGYYQEFDNYKAININKIKDIPKDFYGEMAVPITFMNYKYDKFEILDANKFRKDHFTKTKKSLLIRDGESTINGKATYVRVLVRRKK